MNQEQSTYTEIPAGTSFPSYSDFRVATELGFNLTYTFSASGKLFGAVLHLPSGWTAKKLVNSSITSDFYFMHDEYGYSRGFIVYNHCETDKDSHVISKEAYLQIVFTPRFEIGIEPYRMQYYRLKLIDHRDNTCYYTSHYYKTFSSCDKKLLQQLDLLTTCLPHVSDVTAYWNSSLDVLQRFLSYSKYTWEKSEK